MAELEQRGFVEAIASEQGPLGRSAAVYDIAEQSGWLLGIDLGSTHVRVAASTLEGVLITEREHPIPNAPTRPNADLGAAAGAIVVPLIKEISRQHGSLRSVCVALSRAVPELRNWQNTKATDSDVPQIVSELGIPDDVPVYAENNVNCAALGESRHGGARGESDVVYLQIGVGLGAGIITGDSLLRGYLGQGGELRKLPSPGAETEHTNAGNVERWLRTDSLVRRYNQSRGDEGETDAVSSVEVLDRARDGLPKAKQVVEEEAAGIGYLVLVLVAVASPTLVIIGGGLGSNDLIHSLIKQYLVDRNVDVEVSQGALGSAATVAGAAALAAELYLHDLLTPHSVTALSSYESRWSIDSPTFADNPIASTGPMSAQR